MAVLSGNLGGGTATQIGKLVDAVGEAQASGREAVRSPTEITDTVPFSSLRPVVTGTGFTFDAAGNPTGGTVTGLDPRWYGSRQSIDPSGPGLSGVSIPLVQLYDIAARHQGATLAPTLLAGGDRLEAVFTTTLG